MDVWIRPLTTTELLALVRYGQRLFSELGAMHDAHLLANVVEGNREHWRRHLLAQDVLERHQTIWATHHVDGVTRNVDGHEERESLDMIPVHMG